METHCVHERTVSRNLLKNSDLSNSLKAHISDCSHCQNKYDLVCHENTIIKEEVANFHASVDMKDHLTREVAMALDNYNEELERSVQAKKRYSFGTIRENILSFGRGLTDPVSLFILFIVISFYLIQM